MKAVCGVGVGMGVGVSVGMGVGVDVGGGGVGVGVHVGGTGVLVGVGDGVALDPHPISIVVNRSNRRMAVPQKTRRSWLFIVGYRKVYF